MARIGERELGKLLQQAEIISAEKYEELLATREKNEKDIEEILFEEGLITPDELGLLTSMQQETSFVELGEHKIEQRALNLISGEKARELNILPVAIVNDELVIAVPDTGDDELMDEIKAKAGMPINPVQADPDEIKDYINLNYKTGGGDIQKEVGHIAMSLEAEAKKMKIDSGQDLAADSPIARTVDMLVAQAADDKASDIHIEPQEDRLRVRYRIDGILHDVMSLPLDVHPPLVSRMKIMSGMNIADRRRPQDGQFSVDCGEGRVIDIRAATTDTVHGEKMVLRLLDKSLALLDLTELGFLPHDLERFQRLIKAPYGMILLSGPTGSGKTTTLYSAIGQLNRYEKNIMTIEDPVEYHFNDISQIQTNDQAGMTFASGLRALMRLDPDVILVGEIRDAETAGIAIQAALTGHLVLSSIHANDSVGVVYRLMDLGVEPFLIASSLLGVVAQRMVRRVCTHCKKAMPAPPAERQIYEQELKERRQQFFYGRGCSICSNTGYRGRTGVHELLTVTEDLRRLILNDGTSQEIRAQAIKDGMVPMWHNAMLKVKQGITTPYEVLRNVASISEQ
ncbi:MAG: GspE/PulE family protein [Dehalococcoidia bacterium]